MKTAKIGVIQICSIPGRPEDNKNKILSFLREAAEAGAELALFPEASVTGYRTEEASAALERTDPLLEEIRKESEHCQIAVCFGYIERVSETVRADSPEPSVKGTPETKPCLYLTQELYHQGQSIHYRKSHLGTREREVFSAGSEFPVLQAPLCTGIQLCWESHIPEISTVERAQGAELLLVPYASGMSGERCRENWMVHLPARASDNGVFLAACNLLQLAEDHRTGKEAIRSAHQGSATLSGIDGSGQTSQQRKGGGLLVLDPKGRCLGEYFGSEEHLLLCELQGPLPRELPEGDMHQISYFDRCRRDLFQ